MKFKDAPTNKFLSYNGKIVRKAVPLSCDGGEMNSLLDNHGVAFEYGETAFPIDTFHVHNDSEVSVLKLGS